MAGMTCKKRHTHKYSAINGFSLCDIDFLNTKRTVLAGGNFDVTSKVGRCLKHCRVRVLVALAGNTSTRLKALTQLGTQVLIIRKNYNPKMRAAFAVALFIFQSMPLSKVLRSQLY